MVIIIIIVTIKRLLENMLINSFSWSILIERIKDKKWPQRISSFQVKSFSLINVLEACSPLDLLKTLKVRGINTIFEIAHSDIEVVVIVLSAKYICVLK